MSVCEKTRYQRRDKESGMGRTRSLTNSENLMKQLVLSGPSVLYSERFRLGGGVDPPGLTLFFSLTSGNMWEAKVETVEG